MKLNKLKPGPFCGGEADIRECKAYLDDAVRVICRGCSVATPKVLANHLAFVNGEEVYITKDHAIRKAIVAWNRRANDEQR